MEKKMILLICESERKDYDELKKTFSPYGEVVSAPYDLAFNAFMEMDIWNNLPRSVVIIDECPPLAFLGEQIRKILDDMATPKRIGVFRCGTEDIQEEWYIKLPSSNQIIPQLAKECGYCGKIFIGDSFTNKEMIPSEEFCSDECLSNRLQDLQDDGDYGGGYSKDW